MKCVCRKQGRTGYRKKWRYIKEEDDVRTVYCLMCRQQWESRAKYTKGLDHHKPDSRTGMTDQDVLDCINSRRIVVNCYSAQVYSRAGKTMKLLTVISRTSNNGTYRFVSICYGGKKKKVALHRLVWMAFHRMVVPDGHDVDHRYSQDDDTIPNLRLLTSAKNRALAAEKTNEILRRKREGA